MKTYGSTCEFAAARRQALRLAFRQQIAAAHYASLDEVARRAVLSPSPRFYVSEERAKCVISRMLRGHQPLKGMRPTKQRMFAEIYRRVVALRQERPHAPLNSLVAQVIESPAPEFYLSPRTALDMV